VHQGLGALTQLASLRTRVDFGLKFDIQSARQLLREAASSCMPLVFSALRIEPMLWLHRRVKPSRLAARSRQQEP